MSPVDRPTAGVPASEQVAPAAVSLAEAFRFWLKLGFISFGGPAGQIAIMHAELVERRRWISEQRFLHALNYCMLLPRPGGAAAGHLHRLADAPHLGRHRGGCTVRAAVAVHPDRAELDLPALRRRAAGGRHLLRPETGGDCTGRARGAPHRHAGVEEPLDVGHRRGLVHRHLRLRHAVPGDRAGGWADRARRRAPLAAGVRPGGGHAAPRPATGRR